MDTCDCFDCKINWYGFAGCLLPHLMQKRDQYDLIYKILVITIYIIYIIIKYFREESRIINVNEETGDGRREEGQGRAGPPNFRV